MPTDLVLATTDLSVFGRSRDPVKVKKLTSKQRGQLQAADVACMAAFVAYMQALKDKGALEVKLDLVKTRQHPPEVTQTKRKSK